MCPDKPLNLAVIGRDSGQKWPILQTCVRTKRGPTGEIFQTDLYGYYSGSWCNQIGGSDFYSDVILCEWRWRSLNGKKKETEKSEKEIDKL